MKVLADNKNAILITPSHPRSGTIDILHSQSMTTTMTENWNNFEASPGSRQMMPAFPPTLVEMRAGQVVGRRCLVVLGA